MSVFSLDFIVKVRLEASFWGDSEPPYKYDVYEYAVPSLVFDIVALGDDGEPEDDPSYTGVGSLFNLREARNAGADIVGICDAIDQDSFDVASALFSKAELACQDTVLEEMFDAMPISSALYVDNITRCTKGNKPIIEIGRLLFGIWQTCGCTDALLYGGSENLAAYGFKKMDMQWRDGMALWCVSAFYKNPDFPELQPTAKVLRPNILRWQGRSRDN